MSIEVKNASILKRLMEKPYHPKLIDLVVWIIDIAGMVYITSAYRPDPHSVHGHCRGLDLRSYIYTSPSRLCARINSVWIYDERRPQKKCAKVHDVGQGVHIHLQVHPKTKYIGE